MKLSAKPFCIGLPGEDRVRGQFRAVVADDQAGQLAEGSDPVELSGNAPAGYRAVCTHEAPRRPNQVLSKES
jgi:hypothetical protein